MNRYLVIYQGQINFWKYFFHVISLLVSWYWVLGSGPTSWCYLAIWRWHQFQHHVECQIPLRLGRNIDASLSYLFKFFLRYIKLLFQHLFHFCKYRRIAVSILWTTFDFFHKVLDGRWVIIRLGYIFMIFYMVPFIYSFWCNETCKTHVGSLASLCLLLIVLMKLFLQSNFTP